MGDITTTTLFNKKILLAFVYCNVVPCLIFGSVSLFMYFIYPRSRSHKERIFVSTFIGFLCLALFLVPTPYAFRVYSFLNLSPILLFFFIRWAYRSYANSSSFQKILMRCFVLTPLPVSLYVLSYYIYTTYPINPINIESILVPCFFFFYSLLNFIVLIPLVGTHFLIQDAKRRRERTRALLEKRKEKK